MTIFRAIIPALWLVFAIYWGISALGAKRNLGVTPWWRQSLLRGGLVVLIVAAIHFSGAGPLLRAVHVYQARSLLLGAIDVWLARRKARPELVV